MQMLISTKGRYALRVMIELAQSQSEKPVPLWQIAEKQEISEKYLEAILKTLGQAGLVRGTRGKGGGYLLACDPDACTAGQILRAAEDTIATVACAALSGGHCARADGCLTLPFWRTLQQKIEDFLDSVTLSQLAAPEWADPIGLPGGAVQPETTPPICPQ